MLEAGSDTNGVFAVRLFGLQRKMPRAALLPGVLHLVSKGGSETAKAGHVRAMRPQAHGVQECRSFDNLSDLQRGFHGFVFVGDMHGLPEGAQLVYC